VIAAPSGGHAKLKRLLVPAGTVWYRITHRHYGSALHFGKGPDARWNDPEGHYGVLYVADSVEAAFAETFGHDVPQRYSPLADKFLDTVELEERELYRIEVRRDLTLGLLHGAGLAALNLDAALLATRDYAVSQRWSRWVYEAPGELDGLRYPSRLLPDSSNTALFERSHAAIQEQVLGPLLHWRRPGGGRDIFDIVDEQGWGLL